MLFSSRKVEISMKILAKYWKVYIIFSEDLLKKSQLQES